ncbi:DUF4349 domain-containing protein [Amycolatopsis rhabdoformis]|uniref:DUF4349 domain-containing protein n=1 Tax=Amycolatopsis rhabdoformis TaxID=1448059 RepID=A0ABZ1I3F4_9PSEU|nr:DUF4349 domain-containing protein [Amycolatopsis rhabdoformis]WSE28927.1 DUF4349 domain-containing protein [Amycolatopsis rhabdoformis]
MRTRFGSTRWRRVAVGAGLLVVLAGCTANESSSMRADSAGVGAHEAAPAVPAVPSQAAPQQGVPKQGVPQQGLTTKAPPPSVGAPGTTDRKLARSARLELSTPKLDDVVARARVIAAGAGGYTGQESTGEASASLSLAVPAEKLDGVLDQLAALGKVSRRELSAQDVTAQVVDVDARLATQRASVDRIRALLAKATSISEISSVESELTSREAALESLEQQQKSLAGSVAMATVALSVTADVVAGPDQTSDDSAGFLAGLAGGWQAFLTFGGGFLAALGALAPFAVVLGIPGGALWWWLRKRRRARVPAAAAASSEPAGPAA